MRNLIKRAESLKALGVKPNKQLPPRLVEDASEEESDQPSGGEEPAADESSRKSDAAQAAL